MGKSTSSAFWKGWPAKGTLVDQEWFHRLLEGGTGVLAAQLLWIRFGTLSEMKSQPTPRTWGDLKSTVSAQPHGTSCPRPLAKLENREKNDRKGNRRTGLYQGWDMAVHTNQKGLALQEDLEPSVLSPHPPPWAQLATPTRANLNAIRMPNKTCPFPS